MRVIELPHGALGFDCWTPLSILQYRAMRALGFRFAARYLDDITTEELNGLLGEGLYYVPVQTARKPGWRPSSVTGTEDGVRSRQMAIKLGLPMGLNIFRDFETPDPLTTLAEAQADADSWCIEQHPGGYDAKVYIGAGMPPGLTPDALYKLPYVGYWGSFSRIPDVAVRAYQMRQLFHYPSGECRVSDVFPEAPLEVANVLIDVDVAFSDYKGGRVTAVSA